MDAGRQMQRPRDPIHFVPSGCRCHMRLIIRERDSMISDLNVSSGIVLIGSHPSCDIYLPDGRLAPRHVIIEPEGDYGWTVRPLDTRLVTTVNDTTAAQPLPAEDGGHDRLCGLQRAGVPGRAGWGGGADNPQREPLGRHDGADAMAPAAGHRRSCGRATRWRWRPGRCWCWGR